MNKNNQLNGTECTVCDKCGMIDCHYAVTFSTRNSEMIDILYGSFLPNSTKNKISPKYTLIHLLPVGEEQLDAPDSPMMEGDGHQTDPRILDCDDAIEPDVSDRRSVAPLAASASPSPDPTARGIGFKLLGIRGE
jgi:hypothetical protein